MDRPTVELIHNPVTLVRDWGTESFLSVVDQAFTFKLLSIKKGHCGGLQYHHFKDECGYLVSGKLLLRHVDSSGKLVEIILESGAAFRFPPGSIHQEEALSDCIIIEASTPYANDRVRCESQFGISSRSSLPSTRPQDVIQLSEGNYKRILANEEL